MDPIVRRLLDSPEPSIRFKVRQTVLEESPDTSSMRALAAEIRGSTLVRKLMTMRVASGVEPRPGGDVEPRGGIITYPERGQTNPYQKWQGPHWTLVCLAEIGYPAGDLSLAPIRDQFYDWLFADRHLRMRTLVIPGQEDRVRRCASQEGYAVWYSLKLGLADERTAELVRRLRGWQWPDGGWNCDKRPEAHVSSFHESLIPIRALALHGRLCKDARSLEAAERAAEVFLKRRLFKGLRNGRIIHPGFALLQYPHFYPYNILAGLQVMTEAGYIRDPRCADALDLLESKRLPDGGFPLEKKNHVTTDRVTSRGTFVDWGPAGSGRMNEFVTADALHILHAAGRFG